jgi:hypothetical protein
MVAKLHATGVCLTKSYQPNQFGNFSHMDSPYQQLGEQHTGKVSMN